MPAHPWTERRRYLAELKANVVRAYRSRSGYCDRALDRTARVP